MFTSRAEYPALAPPRQRRSPADRRWRRRLAASNRIGRRAGPRKKSEIARVEAFLQQTRVEHISLAQYFVAHSKRHGKKLSPSRGNLSTVSLEVAEQVVNDIKYSGYLVRQQIDVERQQRLAEKRIPTNFNFHALGQLRVEAREKLARVQPASLAQASRISGITPARSGGVSLGAFGGKEVSGGRGSRSQKSRRKSEARSQKSEASQESGVRS